MKILILFVILLPLIQPCRGVEFKNLDFQSPNVRRITEHFGFVRDVIPGWRLQIGEQDQDWMFYNNVCLSCASAQLFGPDVPRVAERFTFSMNSGVLLDASGNMPAASIYQVGEIPTSAKSIYFQVSLGFQTTIQDLRVSLNRTGLMLVEIDKTGHWTHYQADISPWAGGSAELRFTIEPGINQINFYTSVGIADIEFSSTPVSAIPEPSTWALLATGLAALGWATRNPRQRPRN